MTTLTDFEVLAGVTEMLASQYNLLLGSILRGNMGNATTMTGTVTLANSDIAIQRFDCNGADRIVKLPAQADANHPFAVFNTTAATYFINLQANDGTSICYIAPGDVAYVIPDGLAGTDGYRLIAGSAFLGATVPSATSYFVNAPDGTMLNGKISPTVVSNDLVLTLLTKAGNTPSAGEPVWIKLNGTWRAITAALSVTKADGTNWFNLGSAELATKEVDLFAYLGYNATDGVVIGYARVPHGRSYDDFSTTTTNEEYCAISTITNAAATDYYHVIGRFAATLSAGAGYTWTVPTYTAKNLIQEPIYETRRLLYQPAYSASGSMTYTSVSTSHAFYRIRGAWISVWVNALGTTGGTASTLLYATLPFEPASAVVDAKSYGTAAEGATNLAIYGATATGPPMKAAIGRYDAANWGLGVNRRINFAMDYAIA